MKTPEFPKACMCFGRDVYLFARLSPEGAGASKTTRIGQQTPSFGQIRNICDRLFPKLLHIKTANIQEARGMTPQLEYG